jgi:hypothetical protein
MPKRKLSDADSGPGTEKRTYNVQTMRLTQKFEHGVTILSRALKTARGFERQKLGRREKTAKSQGGAETLQRLAEEVSFLKVCLYSSLAHPSNLQVYLHGIGTIF